MSAPNIVNVASIYGKISTSLVTTSMVAIVSNAAASGKVIKINTLMVGNTHATSAYDVTVEVYRGSTSYRFTGIISIPAKSGLDVISRVMYLEEGDSLRISASANSYLEAICSYEEIA